MTGSKRHYIFTNKKNPTQGIMSTIFGILSLAFLIYLILVAYRAGGIVSDRVGAGVFLCLLFSLAGLILGALGKAVHNSFHALCYVGIAMSLVSFVLIGIILYCGMYLQ